MGSTANANANANMGTGERRRSSASSGSGLFNTLSSQKRGEDPSMAARRASYAEQANKGNFLSQWWSGYTKGQ